MAGLCIPKSISDKVRTAIKSGDIKLEGLYDMSDEDRRTVFSHYTGKDSASLVNATFEKAMIDADKKAKADYVTASDKPSFARKATAGEFGKKLLTPEETKSLTLNKLDKQITDVQARQKVISDRMDKATGENKLNLKFKVDKLQDKIDRLNVKKEDTQNPSSDILLRKINEVGKLLSPDEDKAMMTDLVKAKMGQDVSPAQGEYIFNKAAELRELAKGNADAQLGTTGEYLAAKENLESYIRNLNPEPTATGIIKNSIEMIKNGYITGISTPLKVAFSGSVLNPTGMIIRRLSNLSLNGEYADEAKAAQAEDAKIASRTGDSIATMRDLNDTGTILGSHKGLGQTFKNIFNNETFENTKATTGTGNPILDTIEKGFSKGAQISHYIAIDVEHNILFQKFYRSAFYDTLNLRASKMAKTEGLTGAEAHARGLEIFNDAIKVEPKTDAGRTLREAGQQAAMKVTNTSNTLASKFSVGLKNGLNAINPDVPFGTLIEPFAKIPASIVENGIKTTPLGAPAGVWDIIKGKFDMSPKNDMETRYKGAMQQKDGWEKLIGIVGSTAVAYAITSQLSKKDFKYDNYGEQFVRMGDFWINTEYFNRLAPNIGAMMALKQNGGKGGIGGDIKAILTGKSIGGGLLGNALNIPGISNANEFVQTALGKNPGKLVSNINPMPVAVSNMFKTRPINRLFFGAHGVETQQEVNKDNADAKRAKALAKRSK